MATSSNVKKKKESARSVKEVLHNHRFYIQFEAKDRLHEINCRAPQTVLQAIRSIKECPEWSKPDKNLLIQRSEGVPAPIIATHFPCCLIKKDKKLIILKSKCTVEEARENGQVLKKECYSVFYIHHKGGTYTAKKEIFISGSSKLTGPLCVYWKKGKSAEEALKRDGRFKNLGSFKLIDCNTEAEVQSSDLIDDLCERKFMIELLEDKQTDAPKQPKSHTKSATKPTTAALDRSTDGVTAASNMAEESSNTAAATLLSQQRGVSVKSALSESSSDADTEEIYKLLHDQFPELKKLMMSRFTADSFQKELRVWGKKFGQVRQSFREFYRHEKVTRNGKLVCKVVVGDIFTGTGFVLIDHYILTNAHLFKTCTDGDRLREGVEVHVIFNYENPQTGQSRPFKVEDALICSPEGDLDYAVLVVNRELFKQFIQKTRKGDVQIPSGLLERVGEMPENGEACIIGHPGGEVKQIDLTFLVEMENRKQAAAENLPQFKDEPYFLFVDQVDSQGIGRIMVGGADAEKVTTYHTFMYHGASGSPVFDPDGFLCGLHTSGFFYGFPKATESVIEFVYSMKTIMTHFVKKLREKNETDLLKRMKAVSGKNDVLKKIFESIDKSV